MVTIKVSLDEAEDTFAVHKNFICFYSPYFKAAFNGSFEEGESQTLNLEDASPSAFAIFVNWLYTQRIEEPNSDKLTMSNLLELWLLADRILIPRLQNETLAILNKARYEHYSGGKFKRVYDNTHEGSPLREYLVSLAGTKCGANIKYPESYPHEMLVDIVNYGRAEKRTQASSKWVRYSEEELKKFYVEEQGVSTKLGN